MNKKPPDVIMVGEIENAKITQWLDLLDWAWRHNDMYLYQRAFDKLYSF